MCALFHDRLDAGRTLTRRSSERTRRRSRRRSRPRWGGSGRRGRPSAFIAARGARGAQARIPAATGVRHRGGDAREWWHVPSNVGRPRRDRVERRHRAGDGAGRRSRPRPSSTSSAPDLRGRTAVLVDDGLATGATMIAAVRWARSQGAVRVLVAVPVGAAESVSLLRVEADEVICPHAQRSSEPSGCGTTSSRRSRTTRSSPYSTSSRLRHPRHRRAPTTPVTRLPGRTMPRLAPVPRSIPRTGLPSWCESGP